MVESLENRTLPSTGWAVPVGWQAHDVAVDGQGSVVVVGKIDSYFGYFDPVDETSRYQESATFIAKYDSESNFQWAQQITTASGGPNAFSVATDAAGSIYVTGNIDGTATYGGATSTGDSGAFFTKLDAGGTFQWFSTLSGATGADITVAPSGRVYATGLYGGTPSFHEDDSGQTAPLPTSQGNDVFLLELDSTTGNAVHALRMGGPGSDIGRGVAADAYGGVYVTGQFSETASFGTKMEIDGSQTDIALTSAGAQDGFLVKLHWTDPDGGTSVLSSDWARRMGGSTDTAGEFARGVAVWDDSGNPAIFVSGSMRAADVTFGDPADPAAAFTTAGEEDIFVARYTAAGDLTWAKQMGGPGGDRANHGLAVDARGNVFTTGYFGWTFGAVGTWADFDPNTDARLLTTAGDVEAFLSMLDKDGNYVAAWQGRSEWNSEGQGVAVGADGSLHLAGKYVTAVDLPNAHRLELPDGARGEGFVWKLDPSKSVLEGTVTYDLQDNPTTHDPGLAGWTVRAFVDGDGDGTFESEVASTTTNIDGKYALSVDLGQDYRLTLEAPTGWLQPAAAILVGVGELPTDPSRPLTGLDFAVQDGSVVPDEAGNSYHTFAGSDTPITIKDTITSTITISESLEIVDLNVVVNLSMKEMHNLEGTLIAPNGARYKLFDGVGSGTEMIDTVFDHEADATIAEATDPTFSGHFRTVGATYDDVDYLRDLYGSDSQGIWRLELLETAVWGGKKPGTLNSWSLSIAGREPPAAPGIIATPAAVTTSEDGTSVSFDVALATMPTGDVTITITGLNLGEGTLNKTSLDFTSITWNTPQSVTVTGLDDAETDGDITYTLVLTAEGDIAYDGKTAEVAVTNLDNDSGSKGGGKGGGGKPRLLSQSLGTASDPQSITLDQARTLLEEAFDRFAATGIDVSTLGTIDVRIADLPGVTLGMAAGKTIWLDSDAAGWGWFVDPTPWDDSEFTTPGDQGEQGSIDALTVIAHELGHLLGFEHLEEGVMQETLGPGIRNLPTSTDELTALLYAWATSGRKIRPDGA